MKRKMIFVCLFVLTMVTACGKNTDDTDVADVDAVVTEEAPEKDVDTTDVDTKEEPVDTLPISSDMDIVLGSEDMPVNDFNNETYDYKLSSFPEVHIKLPKGTITDTNAKDLTCNGIKYAVAFDGCNAPILVDVTLKCLEDCHCGAKHEERISYGQFEVDHNWRQIAIDNMTDETALIIAFSMHGDYTDEDYQMMKDYARLNIEYVKEQVAGWDQNFVSEDTKESDTDEDAPAEVTTTKYIGEEVENVIEIDNIDTDDAYLRAVDSVGYTYEFPVVHFGGMEYHAMDGDTVALQLYISNSNLMCNTEFEDYCNLYGAYTLSE